MVALWTRNPTAARGLANQGRKHGLLADERLAENAREEALRVRRIDHHRVRRRALAPQGREDRVEDADPLERMNWS
jgi:hypothetical protein